MNSFGKIFRISLFGESHGKMIGVTIDGCPAGLELQASDFEDDLSRRRSGAHGTTPRRETDSPNLVSGILNGKTTGAPVTILFENQNIRPADYQNLIHHPRPGHADFTAMKKFGGYADPSGGGHFSGRLTLALVAAGVVAKKLISPVKIAATLMEAGGSIEIDKAIQTAAEKKDSIGGIIECRAENIPAGLGEPFFDPVESILSHLIFAIPAIKGIEFGSGFGASKMTGSQHNDPIISENGKTLSNNAGGINGGITNSNDLIFRVAVKPASSIASPQYTYSFLTGKTEILTVEGRHDVCIALRVPPVIEAAVAVVLADLMFLEQRIGRICR